MQRSSFSVVAIAFCFILMSGTFAASFSNGILAPFTSLQYANAASGSGSSGSTYVEFQVTDEPGKWFRNKAGDITGTGTESLAVVTPGAKVDFGMGGNSGTGTNTVHTITSLIFPTGAQGMPVDQPQAHRSSVSVTLNTPGLYVFTCKVHPYMFAGVIVDDPNTTGLDLGEQISLVNGITVPTSSDLATRLLRTFFIATNPTNWQDYTKGIWHITYPNVDVRITGGAVVNLPAVLNQRYGNDAPLSVSAPITPGVGDVLVNTQFEKTSQKSKPSTITTIDTNTWTIKSKLAFPQINMNNAHNMWTNRDQSLIYATQWFDSKMAVFERTTGKLINNIDVGKAPSHVMTRVNNDEVHVALNGEDSVLALTSNAKGKIGNIKMQGTGEGSSNPHAHWMSHDGSIMVTPNAFSGDSSKYHFSSNTLSKTKTGNIPIATGMTPDSSKYYVANLLDSTITVIETATGKILKTINLLANYDPISGAITGPVGALPIQTPVSPDGKSMVTANTLTATITVTDPRPNLASTDKVVAMLGCDAGCHGVQYGAKKGGGYYAYVTSKFSNAMIVVDSDPNGDGNPSDAAIVGKIALVSPARDDRVTANPGMGGQGILTIPVVYNGWVQKLPQDFKDSLTAKQQNPYP